MKKQPKDNESQISTCPTCSASLRSMSDIGGLLTTLLSLDATVTAASASACSNVLPLLLLLLMPFTQLKDLKQKNVTFHHNRSYYVTKESLGP